MTAIGDARGEPISSPVTNSRHRDQDLFGNHRECQSAFFVVRFKVDLRDELPFRTRARRAGGPSEHFVDGLPQAVVSSQRENSMCFQ